MMCKIKTRKAVSRPDIVAFILGSVLKSEGTVDRDKEHFWTIGLNTRNVVKYVELVSLGTINASIVHPREVFRTAIYKAVTSIVIGHNHPSGNPEPSEEDLKLTRRLVEAGKVVGIDVLDHTIIGSGGQFYSFKERGIM
jgi:DNA repair protein RadC